MKSLWMIVVLVAIALPACCDGTATLIRWPGWECSSTEDLSLGHKHTSFPLTHLFDNNQATAWVFSGTGKHAEYGSTGFGLHLSREDGRKPCTLDSIWVMNGYNKSRKLFFGNNRITELKLYVDWKFVKTVALTDSMGWHKISIARQPIKDIALRFTKFQKGRDNDVCVSEIALYDRGKRIDLKMPQAVEFTRGDTDCGCGQEFGVINRSGRQLARNTSEGRPSWSPKGTRIAGFYSVGKASHLWVVDAHKARVIYDRRCPVQYPFDPAWVGEDTIRVKDTVGSTGKLVRVSKR